MTGAEGLTGRISGIRVFVTGGSGFIGRAVCQLLMNNGAEVLNYDLNPWPGTAGPRTIIGDIEDAKDLGHACQDFDPSVFIHLAAFASVTATSRDAFTSIWNGTRVAANAFAGTSNPEVFLNVSTQLVIRPGPQPRDLRAYDPYTPYGEAKAEAEQFLDTITRPYKVVHVRPTNIWGPHQPSYARTVMRYLEKGWYLHPETGKPIIRTYGYVENCAKQVVSLAFAKAVSSGQIFYSGDGAIDSGQFLDAMSEELRGRPVRRIPVGLIRIAGATGTMLRRAHVPFPLDRDRVMRMSTDYIVPLDPVHELAAFPYVPFDIAVRRTAKWYQAGAGPMLDAGY